MRTRTPCSSLGPCQPQSRRRAFPRSVAPPEEHSASLHTGGPTRTMVETCHLPGMHVPVAAQRSSSQAAAGESSRHAVGSTIPLTEDLRLLRLIVHRLLRLPRHDVVIGDVVGMVVRTVWSSLAEARARRTLRTYSSAHMLSSTHNAGATRGQLARETLHRFRWTQPQATAKPGTAANPVGAYFGCQGTAFHQGVQNCQLIHTAG